MFTTATTNWPLCDGVTLRVPVVQAPLGLSDGPRLAAEVSRAGGLGCVSLFAHSPASAGRLLARVQSRTPRPFLVALTGQWEPESVLDACLEREARLFYVFWWNGPRLAPRIRAQEATLFWQVSTVEQALEAAEHGANVLVAQGREAGGQVRGAMPLAELVPRVSDATGLPIVGGGGLAGRDDVVRVLAWGARAAMLGTRFVASEEARATPAHKARLVRARAKHLHLDTRLAGSWPCSPRRILRSLLDDQTRILYAGMGVDQIRGVRPAAELVRTLAPKPNQP